MSRTKEQNGSNTLRLQSSRFVGSPEDQREQSCAIIGAGPAGLTAAYLLTREDCPVTVFESDPIYVGGISRTVQYKGFHFDIGGHRFFSKSKEVEDLWTEILPDDMLLRPRSSKIYYRGKLFAYPLRPFEALLKLGIIESAVCMLSYAKAKLVPEQNPRSFEQWVTNQFGSRLFRIFFKTYTEKVWGMSCSQISADWAAQRIKGLSLGTAIRNALLPKPRNTDRSKVVKTLIDSFRYPRLGPGMLWEACADKVRARGGNIHLGHRVQACEHSAGGWTVTASSADGVPRTVHARNVICSAPIRDLVRMVKPRFGERSRRAAESLRYRDFITVALVLKERNRFGDNWIYIHDPGVKVGRIQNFRSWSPEMVPDQSLACYGLEYFCFEGDGMWTSSDRDLIGMAERELLKIGLAEPGDVVDGCVVRQPKAYPVYDDSYAEHVETIQNEIEERFPGLHLVGRNGMHKYNNQDHAMMTAMLTVRNIIASAKLYDVWRVNQDAEYHESGSAGEAVSTSGLRAVPRQIS
jgi:protoporphyrinogen oxidase